MSVFVCLLTDTAVPTQYFTAASVMYKAQYSTCYLLYVVTIVEQQIAQRLLTRACTGCSKQLNVRQTIQ